MPNLCRAVEDLADEKKNVWAVAEVIGQFSGTSLADHISSACAGEEVSVERVELQHLPAVSEKGAEGRRGVVLGDNGMLLRCSSLRRIFEREGGMLTG